MAVTATAPNVVRRSKHQPRIVSIIERHRRSTESMDRQEILETLVCDLGQRPADAPTTAEILPAVRSVQRDGIHLVVMFDPTHAETVTGFVAAERQCCSRIGWDLDTSDGLRLCLSATASQLDALEHMFSTP